MNFFFRGTTLDYEELLSALENIIIDKVAIVPTVRNKNIDTSALTEIGMAAKDDYGNSKAVGDQRILEIALQAVYKEDANGNWRAGKGPN